MAWTDQTIRSRKLDIDDLLSKAIPGRRPRTTQLSGGASDRLALPIDLEVTQIETTCGFGLPTVFQSNRAKQLDVIPGSAFHHGIGIPVATIHHMPAVQTLQCRPRWINRVNH